MAEIPADWRQRIFVVDRGARREAVQAYSIGATDLLERPFDRKLLLAKLLSDTLPLAGDMAAYPIGASEGVAAGAAALQGIFGAIASGDLIELKAVYTASEALVANIEADGLAHWIDVVRKHHSQTYQHCLLVTGVAVAFGLHLGFTTADQHRLAFAGLMHGRCNAAASRIGIRRATRHEWC
jgi:HD-GYP domain-containing protein (c-di-GMP phosphodiesterase class II)